MKSPIVILPLILAIGSSASAATLLFSDNFNAPDGPLGSAPLDGRLSGLAAGETALQGFGNAQSISGNQLSLAGTANSGVRFGPQTNRYDWAGSTTGAAILAAGGFTVTLDWTYSTTTSDWLAFKIGGPNNDSNVNAASVDYTILVRENGDNEIFDNGLNLGSTGVNFTPTPGVSVPVQVTYLFDSFADGSTVNVTATVDGVEIVSSSFTWDGNSGQSFFEIQSENPYLIDNLAIATVPEAGTSVLGLIGGALLVRRKRR